MQAEFTIRKSIGAGQTFNLAIRPQMTVVALRGAVHIACPAAWLCERMMRQSIALQEGEAHQFSETGWISISSRHGAEVACVEPASTGRWRDEALVRLHAFLRRLSPAKTSDRT